MKAFIIAAVCCRSRACRHQLKPKTGKAATTTIRAAIMARLARSLPLDFRGWRLALDTAFTGSGAVVARRRTEAQST
jgi:hypothetical protein